MTPPTPDPLKKFSDELHALAARFQETTVTLREVIDALGARAAALLIVILALPFCAPVAIPGLSTPFGLAILALATCYALGLPPWLPRRLLAVKLPPKFFRAVLNGASKLIGWIERRLRPRWLWLTEGRAMSFVHMGMIGAGAGLLLLPLGGIPFTNTLPALVIVIGMLGVMERDGAAVAVAYGLLITTLVYFALFATAVIELIARLRQHLGL
ncbi:MAG: hypothetical protein RLZZ15_2117 [Verrucomicrobiota bacterium]|jgi:hypothetical protein